MATTYDNVSLRQYNGVDWDTLKVVPSSHEHSGADITSGYVPVARLGSGTPSSSTFLRGDGAWIPNVVLGSSYPSTYAPASGDMLMYGTYGWATQTPQEWAAITTNSFLYVSSLLATISSNTTTTISTLYYYKLIIVEMVYSGIRATQVIRYVNGQTVSIANYIAGSYRYVTIQTNSGNIVTSGITSGATIYIYGVK